MREFDRAAEKFDDNDPSVYNMCHKDYPDVLREVITQPFDDLLYAVCGTGAMFGMFVSDCPGKRYPGIGLSEKVIDAARSKNLDGVKFIVGDCETLPFPDESFDVVTCSMSFHHYPEPDRFFASLKRILNPGGRLVLLLRRGGGRSG